MKTMITSIEIRDFRGIASGRLDGLMPLTVLTGPNACGKSAVLDALLIGASEGVVAACSWAVQRHPLSLSGARWLVRSLQDRAYIIVGFDNGSTWERRLRASRLDAQPSAGNRRGPREAVHLAVSQRFHSVGEDEKKNRVLQVDLNFSAENHLLGWTEGPELGVLVSGESIRLSDPGVAESLHSRFSELKKANRLSALADLMRPLVPGFKTFEILTDGDLPSLYIDSGVGSVPLAMSGDGVQAFAQLAMEISAAAASGGPLLIEEPEVYQHPRAIQQSAKALVAGLREGVQIVMTTHSLELIDALVDEASESDLEKMGLFNLSLNNGELRSSRRVGDELRFARQELERDLR